MKVILADSSACIASERTAAQIASDRFMPLRLMTIGQLARQSNLTPRAIRYYEEVGLIQPPVRTESNYRLFDSESAERLRFISKCRALGFSLAEVRDLLGMMGDPEHTCAQVKQFTMHHLELVDAKLQQLMDVRRSLTKYLSRCTGQDISECPVLDFLKKPT